tara:strand:+ start:685 stop:1608 length:924 start_codon:yes stop_codon:yes gene_type:complete
MSTKLRFSKKVKEAFKAHRPILALESTIIAHGMPYPNNIEFAIKAESSCLEIGVTPATVAIINGEVCVGLESDELEKIAKGKNIKKISMRELGLATGLGWSGATTVSASITIAQKNKIKVFSTGGIGGVHRGAEHSFDISQDLVALSKTPIIVVSSGAKSILDLHKTIELLETFGVPTLGYNTTTFPAFYSRSSGIDNVEMVKSTKEIFDIFNSGHALGLRAATLVTNPIPVNDEIPFDEIKSAMEDAEMELEKKGIVGKKATPFLLNQVVKKTEGKSLNANISLALNNVRLGAEIAKEFHVQKSTA